MYQAALSLVRFVWRQGRTVYNYDPFYGRLVQVQHKVNGVADACQQVDYWYDNDTLGYSQNASGRVAQVTYRNSTCDTVFTEAYQYNKDGEEVAGGSGGGGESGGAGCGIYVRY
jgi:hypothetical protein